MRFELYLMGVVHVFEPRCRGEIIGQGINLDSVNWGVKKKKKRKKRALKQIRSQCLSVLTLIIPNFQQVYLIIWFGVFFFSFFIHVQGKIINNKKRLRYIYMYTDFRYLFCMYLYCVVFVFIKSEELVCVCFT